MPPSFRPIPPTLEGGSGVGRSLRYVQNRDQPKETGMRSVDVYALTAPDA
jgi:hypothetical protein